MGLSARLRVVTGCAVLALAGGCIAPRESAEPVLPMVEERAEMACGDPRPQVCTMEYAPTCALLGDGSRKQYSSPCNACADDQVVATVIGSCPE